MGIDKKQARALLKEHQLRSTAPRLAVISILSEATTPLSHTEVLRRLGETDWDPTTIYRNLVKLREVGIASVVSRAEGIDRYALSTSEDGDHRHPHFVCEDCGQISCLPADLAPPIRVEGKWSASIRQAMVQLRGECPDCLDAKASR